MKCIYGNRPKKKVGLKMEFGIFYWHLGQPF